MKFGQYELLELIAVGGMAEVFKGRVVAAEGFEKFVAIKRILPDLAEDERFVKMLLTEARIHSALSHRNIVQIHDLGISEDGQYFIVLEYVEGYDLRIITEQLAAEGEIIPEVLSLHIASELAQGLHFAHELKGEDGQPLGLIHRDVTPSNVLISLAGEVKLSDFGLAKRRHDRSVVGSLKGNLSYMSPEQAMQVRVDRRTDIFSLGAVLFELLTGRRLREITNEVAGFSQVASGVVPSVRTLRPDLPTTIERLLDRALAADPDQRFPDAGAFGNAIRQALAEMNVPVGASDLGALLGVVNPPRRPRSLTIERSKVIRLGPEARALREAFAAPATPAPTVGLAPRDRKETPRGRQETPRGRQETPRGRQETPRAVPPRKTPPTTRDAVGGAARTVAALAAPAARSAAPAVDPDATPPPTTPLPPLRPRASTPRPPTTADGQRSGPPPDGRVRRPSNPPMSARGPLQSSRTTTGQHAAAVPQRAPGSASGRTQPIPGTPAHGIARPQPGAQARRTQSAPFGMPSAALPAFAPGRPQRETARVQQLRPRSRWRSALLFLIVIAGGGAAAVHRWVVPLDVLAAWRNPAQLSIATDPSGAGLRLDGATLPGLSPTTVAVRRDLLDHVVEATLPGYRPARAIVRYDKTLALSFLMPLQAAPPPPKPEPPQPSAPQPSGPVK